MKVLQIPPSPRGVAGRGRPRAVPPPPLLRALVALLVVLAFAAPAYPDAAETELNQYDAPVDEAIDRGLAYLAKQQQKNGSFAPTQYPVATTGLAVMAFLAKGHTPGCGPYGDAIDRGIDYVLSTQSADGAFPPRMYSHAIAAVMLSEVSGMVGPERQARIDEALAKALKVIVAAQQVKKPANQQGGWRYAPTSNDSDISCTGWSLMALRSARNNGAEIPKKAIDDAVRFVEHCRMPDGGFAYQPGSGSGLARTGTGLLCLELCGKHREKVTLEAGDWILKNLPKQVGEAFFYYGLYYSAQGMFQLGEAHWLSWAGHMYEMMLKFQQKDGSWPQGSSHEAQAGPCYATAMAILAMSVTYRQLPIYQR